MGPNTFSIDADLDGGRSVWRRVVGRVSYNPPMYKTSTFCLLPHLPNTHEKAKLLSPPLHQDLALFFLHTLRGRLFFSPTSSFVNQRKRLLSFSLSLSLSLSLSHTHTHTHTLKMAEDLSQNAWKPTPISTTGKLYKKLASPIRISLSTSSLIFFIISFSLLSISLLSLSSEHYPTFCFLLSNSIIFFIAAADSNPSNPDFYNEYLTHSTTTTPTITHCTLESSPDSASHQSEPSKDDSEEKPEPPLAENEKLTISSSLKFLRRKSEEAVGCEKMLLPSTTENGEGYCGMDACDDHLSSMSDEELNRRIEEFITKFNREILLQEMAESGEEEI